MYHPPEVLCQIFHYAVGDSGIRGLLPLLHVCCRWRRIAFGDSSLWTTIYLSDTTPPLLDMILTYAGERLFRVHVDHPDIGRGAKLWKLVDRIEELDCSYGTRHTPLFLSSSVPAQNLRAFRLCDRQVYSGPGLRRELPRIFRGCLPSLREVSLAIAVTWPIGIFKDLRSFELGVNAEDPIYPILVLDVLRKSPLLENLRLVGHCELPNDELPAVNLPSLRNCTLIGNGALSIIWYMDIPASTNVSLSTSPLTNDRRVIYPFRDLLLAPHLHALDEVSTVSFSVGYDTVTLRAQNNSGGVLGIQTCYHKYMATGFMVFSALLRGSFNGFPIKFQTTKEFSLHVERGVSFDVAESACCSATFLKFISGVPSLERINFCGVPAMALSFLLYLHKNPDGVIMAPNLQRLYIESTPLHSAESLLQSLSTLLRWRKEEGVPLQFVDMKVNCETLIPMAKHSAFLITWEGLVGGDVKVGYSRERVEKLPRRGLRLAHPPGADDSEDEEEGDEAGTVKSDGSGSEWESWISGQWPKAASEMRRKAGKL